MYLLSVKKVESSCRKNQNEVAQKTLHCSSQILISSKPEEGNQSKTHKSSNTRALTVQEKKAELKSLPIKPRYSFFQGSTQLFHLAAIWLSIQPCVEGNSAG